MIGGAIAVVTGICGAATSVTVLLEPLPLFAALELLLAEPPWPPCPPLPPLAVLVLLLEELPESFTDPELYPAPPVALDVFVLAYVLAFVFELEFVRLVAFMLVLVFLPEGVDGTQTNAMPSTTS